MLDTFKDNLKSILNTLQTLLVSLILQTTGILSNSSKTVQDMIWAAGNQTVTLLSKLNQQFWGSPKQSSPEQSNPQIIPAFPSFT
jgi:hypothetical protein